MSQTEDCCCKGHEVKVCGTVKVDTSIFAPDLDFGKETAMNMRYRGKQVYATLVDFGPLPNNTTKLVDHGIENIEWAQICECYSHVFNPADGIWCMINKPDKDKAAECWESGLTKTQIGMSTGVNRSMLNAVICIVYTKMDVIEEQ